MYAPTRTWCTFIPKNFFVYTILYFLSVKWTFCIYKIQSQNFRVMFQRNWFNFSIQTPSKCFSLWLNLLLEYIKIFKIPKSSFTNKGKFDIIYYWKISFLKGKLPDKLQIHATYLLTASNLSKYWSSYWNYIQHARIQK